MSHSERVLIALQEQDLANLSYHLDLALQEDADELLLELGNYLESIGFLPQAQQVYARLVADYPELAINLANIAMEDGEVEQAFTYVEQIAPTSPFYLEALMTKADFYQLEGLADVAREKLLEAHQLSDEPLITLGLAEIDMELENFSEAIQYYARLDNRAIHEETGISTYQRIGLAYANLGKFEPAIEFLEKAVELEYDDQTLFELATLLFEQAAYQRANLYFKQLVTLNPDFEGYAYPYAQSLHAEHQTQEALSILEDALTKNEMDTAVLLLASQYAYELKDAATAEKYLLQAREWAEDWEEIDLRLASLYLEQARYEDLIALDREDLDHVLTRWQIAKGYLALEQTQVREKYADLATDLADNPEFLKEYGFLLRELGEMAEAKVILTRYLKLVPDDLEAEELLQTFES